MCWRAGQLFKRTLIGCRNGPTGTSRNSTRKMLSPTTREQSVQAAAHPGAGHLQQSCAEEDLELLLDKLNMSQECTPVAKAANGTLGCIDRSMANRSREVFFSPSAQHCLPHPRCCAQLSAPHYQ